MADYINDDHTDATSTWSPPTKKECVEEMVFALTEYESYPWWGKMFKKYLLERALLWASRYNNLTKLK